MASKITYLTDKEFYIGVSKKLNISPEKVKEYWEQGFLEFIIHEVYYNCLLYTSPSPRDRG